MEREIPAPPLPPGFTGMLLDQRSKSAPPRKRRGTVRSPSGTSRTPATGWTGSPPISPRPSPRRPFQAGFWSPRCGRSPRMKKALEEQSGVPDRREAAAQMRQRASDFRLHQGAGRHLRGPQARGGARGRRGAALLDGRLRAPRGAALPGVLSRYRSRWLDGEPRAFDRHHEREARLPRHRPHVGGRAPSRKKDTAARPRRARRRI